MGNYYTKIKKSLTPKNKDPDGLRKSTPFKIFIVYAFSCGYDEMYQFCSRKIERRFPFVKIEGKQMKIRDGSFEITMTKIDGMEKIIHSKLGGDGPITVYNIENLLDKILEFLYDKKKKYSSH